MAQQYDVRGYPTIKFLRPGGQQPIDYSGARTEAAFLEFLNDNCGTNRVPGGGLNEFVSQGAIPQTGLLLTRSLPLFQAGRIPSIDSLASHFMSPTATRPNVLESASAVASSLTDKSSALASYYVKVMSKFASTSLEEAREWIDKESTRLGKMLSNKGSITGQKRDELTMKQNVSNVSTFTCLRDKREMRRIDTFGTFSVRSSLLSNL